MKPSLKRSISVLHDDSHNENKRRKISLNTEGTSLKLFKPTVKDLKEKSEKRSISVLKEQKFKCVDCDISFETETKYKNHCLNLHSPMDLFSSDETPRTSKTNSRKFKKTDNVNLIKNVKNVKRKRSLNESHIGSSSKKTKETLDSSENDVQLIHETPNIIPVVLDTDIPSADPISNPNLDSSNIETNKSIEVSDPLDERTSENIAGPEDREWICEDCSKVFKLQRRYRYHIPTHDPRFEGFKGKM